MVWSLHATISKEYLLISQSWLSLALNSWGYFFFFEIQCIPLNCLGQNPIWRYPTYCRAQNSLRLVLLLLVLMLTKLEREKTLTSWKVDNVHKKTYVMKFYKIHESPNQRMREDPLISWKVYWTPVQRKFRQRIQENDWNLNQTNTSLTSLHLEREKDESLIFHFNEFVYFQS